MENKMQTCRRFKAKKDCVGREITLFKKDDILIETFPGSNIIRSEKKAGTTGLDFSIFGEIDGFEDEREELFEELEPISFKESINYALYEKELTEELNEINKELPKLLDRKKRIEELLS